MVTGYKVSRELWQKAETRAVKQGILKKGGYMNIREHIEERGREKGWREGQKEGIQKGIRKIVLNMLQERADISFISKMTGLSEEEIKELKNGS